MRKILAILGVFVVYSTAFAVPLDSWPTWSTAQPYVSKQVPPGAMIVRGSGTNAYYVLEVDPTTGELPVSVSSGLSVTYSGPTGSSVPAEAAYVAGIDGSGDLQGLSVNGAGELNVILQGPYGQSTMANSVPVAIASNQTDLPVAISAASTISVENLPTTVSTNTGASDASTLRVSEGSRAYSDSARYDYTGGSVTTGAWTQVLASTAAAINYICVTDQSGQIMELGTGAVASETRVFLIARGFSGCIPLRIAASTRISVRAVSATASTGDLVISGMN